MSVARTRPGSRRLRLGVGAALGVLIVLRVLDPLGAIGAVGLLGANIGGTLLAVVGLRRHPGSRGWRWVAASIGSSAVAEVVFWAYSAVLHREAPGVSWADPLWLLSYVTLAVGAARIFRLKRARAHYREVDALMDMAAAGIVGLLTVWVFALEPTMSDSATPLATRLLWSAYPILDVALLAALVGGMLVVRRRTPPMILLCCGVACWLAADFTFVLLGTTGLDIGVWMDAGWMVGAAVLGLAVHEGSAASPATAESAPAKETIGRLRLAVGFAPLLVPSALEIWGFQGGEDPNPWPLALATAALAYLAFARCLRLVRSKDAARATLDASELHYRTLAAHSSDAMLVVSRTGKILHESDTFARLASLPVPIVGVDVTKLPSIVDPEILRDLLRKAALVPGEVVEAEVLVRHQTRGERWFALRVVDMVDDTIGGVVVNLRDVTSRRHAEDELRTQAFHDSLTGLANRALFRDRVGHALESRGRTGVDPAVLFIDLDEFKFINDTLGHDAGDQLLRTTAQRLLLAVRAGDTVARLGGDEFAVLLESGECAADAPGVAARILEILPQPIEVLGRSLQITCSVGIALGDDRSDISSLLRHADMAMYDAKAQGKGRWARYDPAMGEAMRERMDLEGDLHGALEGGQYELLYQPVFGISSWRLTGFEALLRWRHPTLGTITPDRFIPILEGNGHIVKVGAWVLEEACRTAVAWTAEAPSWAERWSMSVNVSSVQLASEGFVDTVEDVLRRTGADPAVLVLEITESSLISDPGMAAVRLEQLRALGVRLAIDDFGTGYSSLSYLRQFSFDILKLDRSFIQTITPDAPLPPIIKGVLDLARTLGIETVAEGIDEGHQLLKLRSERCEKGQGYLFAQPLSVTDAHALLVAQTGSDDGLSVEPVPVGL